jgi:rubrerythrin
MPLMIQQHNIVAYECPVCGFIMKDEANKRLNCPKCSDKITKYTLDKLRLQSEEGCLEERY